MAPKGIQSGILWVGLAATRGSAVKALSHCSSRPALVNLTAQAKCLRRYKWVQQKAIAIAEKNPEFKDFVEAVKKVALAKELREKAVAANPDNRNLAGLAAIPERLGKHMRISELREECKKRGLPDSGFKKALDP